MLAITVPTFGKVSETFIRAHVEHLSPGRIALVCNDLVGGDMPGCPVFVGLAEGGPVPASAGLAARMAGRIRALRGSRDGPDLDAATRRGLLGFFRDHGVARMLAEYGPVGSLVWRTCREAGLPLFVHFHGHDASALLRDRQWLRNYRHLFAAANGIIVPSAFLAGKLIAAGCPRAKLHISPYGIDPEAFQAAPERNRNHVLAVGRLVPKKAPDRTIAAFARIADRFPDLRLDIVGDGPLRGACEAAISSNRLHGRVRLLGEQDHRAVKSLMASAGIFIQHSVTAENGDSEGMPVAIMEAMAAGLPVVATLHSGIPELVIHGETGLLVAEGDIPGMGDALGRLLGDPELAATMGARGRARALADFTRERSFARLRSILGMAGDPPRG